MGWNCFCLVRSLQTTCTIHFDSNMKKEVLDLDELLAKATHALEERQAAMMYSIYMSFLLALLHTDACSPSTLQAANQAGNDPLKSIKLDSGFSSKDLYVENATRYKSLKIDSSKTVLVCEPAHTNAQKNYSSLRTKAHVGPEHLPTRPISHLDSSSLSQGSNGKCMVRTHLFHISCFSESHQTPKETSGPQWFGIPAPDMTEDLKRDLHIIRSRTVIDPKRHYKKGTMSKLPKFFQVHHSRSILCI